MAQYEARTVLFVIWVIHIPFTSMIGKWYIFQGGKAVHRANSSVLNISYGEPMFWATLTIFAFGAGLLLTVVLLDFVKQKSSDWILLGLLVLEGAMVIDVLCASGLIGEPGESFFLATT